MKLITSKRKRKKIHVQFSDMWDDLVAELKYTAKKKRALRSLTRSKAGFKSNFSVDRLFIHATRFSERGARIISVLSHSQIYAQGEHQAELSVNTLRDVK